MSTTIPTTTIPRYVAHGPVRGGCGHRHLSTTAAQECADRDAAACGSWSARGGIVTAPGAA